MTRPYARYHDTPLWRALTSALVELQATGEVHVQTASDYVVGYLCRELEAKSVVLPAALTALGDG